MRLFILILILLVPMLAQEKPKIKQVPPTATSPASGSEMFKAYCASCHGLNAKGAGPAAPAMKKPVPDLTMLAKKNGGKFPENRVYNAIQGDMLIEAHGSAEMPVWGHVFRTMTRDESQVRMRFHNLTKYIESLQTK